MCLIEIMLFISEVMRCGKGFPLVASRPLLIDMRASRTPAIQAPPSGPTPYLCVEISHLQIYGSEITQGRLVSAFLACFLWHLFVIFHVATEDTPSTAQLTAVEVFTPFTYSFVKEMCLGHFLLALAIAEAPDQFIDCFFFLLSECLNISYVLSRRLSVRTMLLVTSHRDILVVSGEGTSRR